MRRGREEDDEVDDLIREAIANWRGNQEDADEQPIPMDWENADEELVLDWMEAEVRRIAAARGVEPEDLDGAFEDHGNGLVWVDFSLDYLNRFHAA